MNLPTTGTSDARKIGPVYLVLNGEMTIDSPVKATWLHVVNYPSWQNFPIVQHVSGAPGKEGEVVMLKKEEEGFEFPPYYARTIKLDPEHRVIWKTYPEQGTQDVDFFGIVEFSLHEAQGKTRFCYDFLYEFLVPYRNENELDTYRKQQYENFGTLLSIIFPKLKKLAESKGV